VSAHIAPHRWADLWAGRVDDAERGVMEAHAERCRACARARERVTRASDSFVSIRAQSSPDLAWDSVRARVHWSVSTERRAKQPAARSRRGWAAFGLVAAAGLAATIFVDRPQPPTEATSSIVPDPSPERPAAPAALAGLVNRTTGDVMIDGIRPKDLFARRLAAGSVIATGDGRVDVQFGTASAFALGPRSTLELRRFDAQMIELVVDGTVDIQLAPRTNGQRFVVHAGERAIEVRGTQFRVRHDGSSTAVACRHGLVAVRDDKGQLEVGAARHVSLAKARPVAEQHVTAMSVEQVGELADATPMTMPIWDLTALATSAPLEIATAGRRDVRLDGVELGAAPLRVRVMPGRHTVEAADSHGRYRRAGWVDVAAPSSAKPARLDVLPETPPTRRTDERRRQLTSGIDQARITQCLRKIAKSGLLTGAYVEIEIGVDAQGAKNYLNILHSDLPRDASSCVEGVLNDIRFKPGAAAEWKQRIEL
jgi:hypothetical protein